MTVAEQEFVDIIWEYYAAHKRNLPWRQNLDIPQWPYHVLISEIMLQQTQVARVIPKYATWLEVFPTLADAAQGSLADYIRLWSGLGYNRRAKYLHDAIKQINTLYCGIVPKDINNLSKLPGVGINTAGAIAVYAYNQPYVFIETNIRSVYIHHFFNNKTVVSDNDIQKIVANTIDTENPREWYWALMDYGTFIKNNYGGNLQKSSHYVPQSAFIGSKRQTRGVIIKQLTTGPKTISQLKKAVNNDDRLKTVLNELMHDNLVIKTGVKFQLPGDKVV